MAKPNNIIEYIAGGNISSKSSSSMSSQQSKRPPTNMKVAIMADNKGEEKQPSESAVTPILKNKTVHFEEQDANEDSEKIRELKSKGEKGAQNNNRNGQNCGCRRGKCCGEGRKGGENGSGGRRDGDKSDDASNRKADDNRGDAHRQADDSQTLQAAKDLEPNPQQGQANLRNQNKPNRPCTKFGAQPTQQSLHRKVVERLLQRQSEYRRRNMPQLIQPSRAEVVIREDVIESPNDVNPNAFFDVRTGILRVYHGPRFGNSVASLSLLRNRNDPVNPQGLVGQLGPLAGDVLPLGPSGTSPPWDFGGGDFHGAAAGTNGHHATNRNRHSLALDLDALSGSWGDKDSPTQHFGPPTPPPNPNAGRASATTDWSGAQPAHTLSWTRTGNANTNTSGTNNGNSNANTGGNHNGNNSADSANQHNSNGNSTEWGRDAGNSGNVENSNNVSNGNTTNGWDDQPGNSGNQTNGATTNGWHAPVNNATTNGARQTTMANPWADRGNRNSRNANWAYDSSDNSQVDNNTLLAGSWNGSGLGPPPPTNNGGNSNQAWGNPNAAQSTRDWTDEDRNGGFAPVTDTW